MRRKQPPQQTITVPWGQRWTQSLKRWRIWIADAAVGHRGYYRKTMTTRLGTETLHLPLLVLYHTFSKRYIAHETKTFRISHNSSEIFILLDSRVTSTPLSKCWVDKQKCFSLHFREKHNKLKCWSMKDLESIFCLMWKWIPAGYEELLFHGWYKI